MSHITRRALRVYAALSELGGRAQHDVLDALIPFFEPILEVMNEKVFDPRVFAVGVQKLYRWRFTADIAEQFIPRLVNKGYLRRHGDRQRAIYVVHYAQQREAQDGAPAIADVLEKIIDEFEAFPPRVTDLLTYDRSRDELKEILIRFVVSLDAYGEAEFAAEVKRLSLDAEQQTLLSRLDEGGTPLPHNDKYMCARFVQHICKVQPEYVPHLARLASIGLLTEVVTDFIKPVTPAKATNLTIIVDAPLALDYLGCSGAALQDDVRSIFTALTDIGCSFVVFPVSCEEMQRNLQSMLALPSNRRHGYTHQALARGEVLPEFVDAVARDPETVLHGAGIKIKPFTLDQYPNSHIHFDALRYEDFLAAVSWVQEVEPREHDATCLALVMRLREGKHYGDVFRSRDVFVTRNAAFANQSRAYCLQSRLITPLQQGPVIHHRELATVAWLRTGLGADDSIPRAHLLASCERVLRVRPEVQAAVAAKLRQVTPEKLEQFDLLLLDHRSVRKLADETLNDEHVVTAENAEHLVQVMRQATAAEERARHDEELRQTRAKHAASQRRSRAATVQAEAERDALRAQITDIEGKQRAAVERLVGETNATTKLLERAVAVLLVCLGAFGLLEQATGWLTHALPWKIVLIAAGLVGGYHLIMDVLQWPKMGLRTVLNAVARFFLARKLRQKELQDRYTVADFQVSNGQVALPDADVVNPGLAAPVADLSLDTTSSAGDNAGHGRRV